MKIEDIKIDENEMQIMTSHGLITRKQLEHLNKYAAEKKQQPLMITPAKPALSCPFNNGVHSECKEAACALYITGKGCSIKYLTDNKPAKDTKGLAYPIKASHKCRETCALYKECGCALTGIKES